MNATRSNKYKAQSMTTTNQHPNSERTYPVNSIRFLKRRIDRKRSLSLLAVALCVLCGSAVSAQGEKTYPTSRVQKFTFADTLEEQEAQLKNNPQLEYFGRVRERQARDRYRPLYHYISPTGTMNDPTGLSFWQGRWHMFYQSWPGEDPRQHWAHVVSDDLIHWRDLPYAIYPGPENAAFSGNAIVEEDRVIAMYLGHRYGEMVATSSDPLLLNWTKIGDGAVIPDEKAMGIGEGREVFDPGIWKKDGTYYALTQRAWGDMEGQLFRSDDLKTWERLHTFVENDTYSFPRDDLSCPNFMPIGDRHIMLFFSHTRGGRYFLGDYDTDRDKFVVTAHDDFNFGAVTPGGVHAPSAFPDGKGGVIVIFNMNPGVNSSDGGQIMTLPRRLTLLSDNEVGVEPAGDISSLRYDHQLIEGLTLPANGEVVLEKVRGNAMEISAEIAASAEKVGPGLLSPVLELNVLRSPNREEYTRIAFFRGRGRKAFYDKERGEGWITIDSSYSSTRPDVLLRAPETASVMLDHDEPLKLRVFIDRSSVEVFVNGRQCVAVRAYPGREDSLGVSLRSQGRDSILTRLDAWQMKSIYE